MVRFDVKSLFSNVPTDGAIKAAEKAIKNIELGTLPLPCVEYERCNELAMGSASPGLPFHRNAKNDHYWENVDMVEIHPRYFSSGH